MTPGWWLIKFIRVIREYFPRLQPQAHRHPHDLLLVLVAVPQRKGGLVGRVLCTSPRRVQEAPPGNKWVTLTSFITVDCFLLCIFLTCLQVLHVVPRRSWCSDVMRFCDQISNETVAFSGMHFFYFTRKLILSVIMKTFILFYFYFLSFL